MPEITKLLGREARIVRRAVAGAPAMAGAYNRPDNGYDMCLRGCPLFRTVNPGDDYPATATLVFNSGADPAYVLQVLGTDGKDDGVRRIFKEVLDTEPATDFINHATVQGDYALGYPVNVSVVVKGNAAGGTDISIA